MTTPIPFGRFLLVERLAIGGMAEVFAAVERGDPAGRLYAVKRMLPTLAEDRELVRMFLDEGRLLAQLDHPGIVAVHEMGRMRRGYYIAMDYVAGRDLRALVASLRRRDERLAVAIAVYVACRAADALDHVHRARAAGGAPLGLVHRDVSPANLLIGFDGEVALIDFGVAGAARPRGLGDRVPRGKFGYMSPEMIGGLPVDRRSDVFALGIVLHELLTGERLFKGATMLAVMESVRAAHAPPPSAANPAVPPELDRAVLRALAREPHDRFAWASDMRDALLPFQRAPGTQGGRAATAELMARLFPERLRVEARRKNANLV